MIKPNELRVGNLFHPTMYSNGIRVPQSTIAKIITIDAFHVLWLPSDLNPAQVEWNESKYNEIEPIPLTSEWLLKFGFKLEDITWYDASVTKNVYCKGQYYVDLRESLGTGYLFGKMDNEYPGYRNILVRPVQYVDQIQNVFYFITGEELTIEE